MIFNLILKLNLKMISDLKIGFESGFESDFQSENVLSFTGNMKMNSQKAHLWAENYTTAIQFCQELFKKFLAHLPPKSQKEKAP